jgi:hypothetical protein
LLVMFGGNAVLLGVLTRSSCRMYVVYNLKPRSIAE